MNNTPNQKEIAECYQPLFDLIFKEHDKALTMSEMDEVISAASKVTRSLDKIYTPTCDVEGCDGIVVSGGGAWEETGYWSLCDVHHFRGFRGKEQPKMKETAVKREAERKK